MPLVATVSDFTSSNLTALLNNGPPDPPIEAIEGPFGRPHEILADRASSLWSRPIDCLVVWTQPHRVISSFAKALEREDVVVENVLDEVDRFAALVRSCEDRARMIIVPTWTLPPWERDLGLMDMRRGTGIVDLLARMNLRIAERLEEPDDDSARASRFFVVDAARWIESAGPRGYSPKAWYLGKIPFGNDVFKHAAEEIRSALLASTGQVRKLVILDLDDTLWGGIVGDMGWENLVLGGHDGEGEAFVHFQNALKALTRRGILLGIVSKNEEQTALDAIRNHPEMVLRPDDFAGWRINWQDKARNVAELTSELNLGLQAVVFIDDNAAERARVRDALPEVLVPEWPADRSLYRRSLLELRCFNTAAWTDEDRQRSAMYAVERKRKTALRDVGSLDDWLETLDVEVGVEQLNDANLSRATQLLNKTNQMNLATRRMTESEFMEWATREENHTWTFRVRDKFGELGLTGILSVETDDQTCRIADFVLSCRVMGRKVEEAMLGTAIAHIRDLGMRTLQATYRETPKNKPCLAFFERSGLSRKGNLFTWDASEEYPFPSQITLRDLAARRVGESSSSARAHPPTSA